MPDTHSPAPRRNGRPYSNPDTIAGVCDGRGIAWDQGIFAGDPELVHRARRHAACHDEGSIHPLGPNHAADDETPAGAAVAIMLSGRGRMILTRYPASVATLIPEDPSAITDDELQDS